jgi:hypothetical protein
MSVLARHMLVQAIYALLLRVMHAREFHALHAHTHAQCMTSEIFLAQSKVVL